MPNSVALLALSASDATVVVTSITLVFAMLVALCLVVTVEGRFFDAASGKKKQQNQMPAFTPPKPEPAAPAPAPVPQAPARPDGIPPEVVAAISAAVVYLEGEGAVVHDIRRLPNRSARGRRGAWGDAGVAQNTRPFM